jgi:uncharacterized linocin/CFP29 family protein
MDPVHVDQALVLNGNGSRVAVNGAIAHQLLTNGFNPEALRPAIDDDDIDRVTGLVRANSNSAFRSNATLQIREWIMLDTAVLNVARRRLVGVADLMNMGLTYPIADAMGITQIQWQKIGVMTPAEVSMSGIAQTENDRQEYGVNSLPLPIVHKEFQMNIRQLATTRRMGTPLDVTQAELCGRLVSETIESMLFLGSTVVGTALPIYGYTTDPYRNTGSCTASWVSATGPQIVGDVLTMIQDAKNDNMYGPYCMYVPSAVFTHMGNDYVTTAALARSIMERVLAIPGIISIKESKDLTASNILLIQMTNDVIDEVTGMEPTTVQWDSPGGMIVNFKVMAIMIPRTKADYVNQSGIVHFS